MEQNNKSIAIVSVVAICLVAVATPLMVMALSNNNDDTDAPVYKIDYNVSEANGLVKATAVYYVINLLNMLMSGACAELCGDHVGTNDTDLYSMTVLQNNNNLIKNINNSLGGLYTVSLTCLEGEVDDKSTFADHHSFILVVN